jgi:hypothetical protein
MEEKFPVVDLTGNPEEIGTQHYGDKQVLF